VSEPEQSEAKGVSDEVRDRILDVAMELAAEGGFENVRQRDVARRAGIALGTLYKRFRSKEEILSALLARETGDLARRLASQPPRGATALERVDDYYRIVTRTLCRKPHLARAMLRAMTSGDAVAATVASYHGLMASLVVAAMRGDAAPAPATADERQAATLLQHVWFASLVGWSAGLHGQQGVVDTMHAAARRMLG